MRYAAFSARSTEFYFVLRKLLDLVRGDVENAGTSKACTRVLLPPSRCGKEPLVVSVGGKAREQTRAGEHPRDELRARKARNGAGAKGSGQAVA
jgi:hypothetical protein